MKRIPGPRRRQRGFFDFSFSELVIIFGLGLVVLGPKKLPGVVAQIGRWVGRARIMARQFREQLEQEVNQVQSIKPVPHSYRPPNPAPVTPEAAAAGTTHVHSPAEQPGAAAPMAGPGVGPAPAGGPAAAPGAADTSGTVSAGTAGTDAPGTPGDADAAGTAQEAPWGPGGADQPVRFALEGTQPVILPAQSPAPPAASAPVPAAEPAPSAPTSGAATGSHE